MIIIMRFGENNVFGPKYIDICQFQRLAGGWHMVHLNVLFIIYKSGKSTRDIC